MCKSRPTGSCRLSGCGLQDSIVECIATMHYLEDQTYGKELVLRSKQIPTPMPNREHSMKNSKNKTNSTKRRKKRAQDAKFCFCFLRTRGHSSLQKGDHLLLDVANLTIDCGSKDMILPSLLLLFA